ncbi:MAG TPA: DUF309 domain-containing protein [Actinomycetota bacterium]
MADRDRADRDRDARGRARSARPRDELGRPLPRDEQGSLVEEQLPDDPEALLDVGVEHFNAERFFQAHEAWETAWHSAPGPERDFWQGITQVAVGFTHLRRGNRTGAVTLLRRGAKRLDAYGERHRGITVGALAGAARAAAEAIEAGSPVTLPKIAR